MGKGIKMSETTWPVIEKKFEKGWPVIIPLGSACKEHGLHLPMNTDQTIAEYLAVQLAKDNKILIAPTVTNSYYPNFKEYTGSSTLEFSTACQYFLDICRHWHQQGVQKFYVINLGISTNKVLESVKKMLNQENINFSYLDLTVVDKDPRIQAIKQQAVGTHADEIETSIMLYIKQEVVQLEKAKPELAPDKPGPLTRDPSSSDKTISLTGAWGDPTLATKEKGKIVLEVMQEKIFQELELTVGEKISALKVAAHIELGISRNNKGKDKEQENVVKETAVVQVYSQQT